MSEKAFRLITSKRVIYDICNREDSGIIILVLANVYGRGISRIASVKEASKRISDLAIKGGTPVRNKVISKNKASI